MLRLLAFALFLASAPALAQNYAGTYTTTNPQGGTVTLVLTQDAKRVSGTLSGNNAVFQVQGEVTPDGLMGAVTGAQGNLYMMARLEGANLLVVLAEPGPTGQPNLQAARQIVFSRATASSKPSGKGEPSSQPGSIDGQLTQLLTSSAWCGFTFNQRSGTSTRERVVFSPSGIVTQQGGTETYSSGPSGTVAGQYGSGTQARWKVSGGMLQLSQDGANWTPQALQVTQNSNGAPIITSGGKEYMRCN